MHLHSCAWAIRRIEVPNQVNTFLMGYLNHTRIRSKYSVMWADTIRYQLWYSLEQSSRQRFSSLRQNLIASRKTPTSLVQTLRIHWTQSSRQPWRKCKHTIHTRSSVCCNDISKSSCSSARVFECSCVIHLQFTDSRTHVRTQLKS